MSRQQAKLTANSIDVIYDDMEAIEVAADLRYLPITNPSAKGSFLLKPDSGEAAHRLTSSDSTVTLYTRVRNKAADTWPISIIAVVDGVEQGKITYDKTMNQWMVWGSPANTEFAPMAFGWGSNPASNGGDLITLNDLNRRVPEGTGAPAGRAGNIGDTYRQTDAYMFGTTNLSGVLWHKSGAGTALFVDWFPDFEGRWVNYTPTWSATGGTPTLGNGTLDGVYTRQGRTISFVVTLNWQSTTSAVNMTDWRLSVPVVGAGNNVGSGYVLDHGTRYYQMVVPITSATRGITDTGIVGHNNPQAAWAAGDMLVQSGTYYTTTGA